MTRKQGLIRRALSLLEGPVDAAVTRAKAWNAKGGLDLTQDPNRTFKRMRDFRNIYLQGGYVAEGIDLFPIYAIGGGYDLEIDEEISKKMGTDGEAEKQTVKEFLDLINFFDVQWQLSVDAAVVRDGVAEIVYGKGLAGTVPVNVIPRPAECFEFTTNLTGAIESYDQVQDNRGNNILKISLEPRQVLHYQFLSRPDSPYGISLVERTAHDIYRDTRVSEAITAGICLHGTPKWHIRANSTKPDAPRMTDAEYSALETEFESFNAKDQFLTEGDVVVEALDTAGVQNVQAYSDVTLIRVAAGMGIPAELLGVRQGTTDATAVSRIGAFMKKVNIVQRDIESLWNLNVIDRITGKPGLIKIKLTDSNPEDFVQIAGAIAALRSGMNPEKVAPYQWCRERLKIPTNAELGIEDVPEDEPAPDPAQSNLQPWTYKVPVEVEGEPEETVITKTLARAVERFQRVSIGIQKRREKAAIAKKYEPAYRDFFERQGKSVLIRFVFMAEYFAPPEPLRLMEAKKPISPAALKRWTDIWDSVVEETTDALQQIVKTTETEAVQRGASQLRGQLKLFDPKHTFTLENPRAVEWFRKNGGSVDYIRDIQQTTADSLKRVITTGLDNGWSYNTTAREIQKLFDGPISTDRARLIATHESAQAYEAGNRAFADSLKDDGIEMEKMWTTSHDDRVSDGCEENEADGWIPIDQPHSSGDQEPPRFPGCRCYEQYRQARA